MPCPVLNRTLDCGTLLSASLAVTGNNSLEETKMVRSISIVAILLSAGVAWGQTPFVENFYQPNSPSIGLELDGDVTGYVDIPDSGRSVTIPAGRVIVSLQPNAMAERQAAEC